jgi:hypothetical protein
MSSNGKNNKGLSNTELMLVIIVVLLLGLALSSTSFLPALSGFVHGVYHP